MYEYLLPVQVRKTLQNCAELLYTILPRNSIRISNIISFKCVPNYIFRQRETSVDGISVPPLLHRRDSLYLNSCTTIN